jgi:hypothetical protein
MTLEILSAHDLRAISRRVAAAILPIEIGATLPVPLRTARGLEALVLFYRGARPPGQEEILPPDHALKLDATTGAVLRMWAITPEDVGIRRPLAGVPGAGKGLRSMDMEAFLSARSRYLDLSPEVWAAFAAGGSPPDVATRGRVREHFELFLRITSGDVAAYCAGAAADFFAWSRDVAGPA